MGRVGWGHGPNTRLYLSAAPVRSGVAGGSPDAAAGEAVAARGCRHKEEAMAKRSLFQILLFAAMLMMLAGCVAAQPQDKDGPASVTPMITTPTAPPTPMIAPPVTYPPPMLTPAVDFADGVSAVPEGQTLLVEYQRIASGKGVCEGVWWDHPAPAYQFDGKQLRGVVTGPSSNRSRVLIGNIIFRSANGRGGETTSITAVDLLPQAIGNGIVLRAVDKQGAIVAEINGQSFWIYPDSRWEMTVERQEGACRATERYTVRTRASTQRADRCRLL